MTLAVEKERTIDLGSSHQFRLRTRVAEQGARTEAGTTWERSLGQSICISHAGDCPHEDPSVVGLDHGLWCCATHDCCYRCLEKQKCGTKYLNYNFAYRKGQIVCGKDVLQQWQLCECDKRAASCFARNRNTYKKKYQFYPSRNCPGSDFHC
ncbi:phospholipase A2, membrane associated-like isoform X3 [Myotis daubentonii]|uniref:phospholipase A2, membrane associated-like isoform X3 n=1 Tax=Myotis daubentonii TaxID=98922 RepID=UPI002873DDF5|nr:phospholipase A2, membrane associated-like isoform X3 [Myotis daubentonii]